MVLRGDAAEPVYIATNQIRRTKEHNIITTSKIKVYKPLSTKTPTTPGTLRSVHVVQLLQQARNGWWSPANCL
ncbi:hypothetical protein NQ315_014664 [Exocentrus adspersus]|uniref:Uncharacterized protein n=1 Tax=Exocentrus adspersus TaxID=1586481 RepID=A0AAV8VQG5_9CUCU|nr:hypothetical protein NQ315_014664 [Exocentrus adspersus]